MRIFLIRHSDPHYPDDSLTPAGHLEAEALAERLAESGVSEIYCSPRGRARLTAGYTARLMHLPMTVEPWMNEWDGLYIEKYQHALWDVDAPLLRQAVTPESNQWKHNELLNNYRLAEHMAHVRYGSDDFLRRQGYLHEGGVYHVTGSALGSKKRIAVFAHLGFGLAWLAMLLEIPLPLMWAGFYLHPSSVTTILMEERPAGVASPRLLTVGDVSHLYKSGLTPSPAGIIGNDEE